MYLNAYLFIFALLFSQYLAQTCDYKNSCFWSTYGCSYGDYKCACNPPVSNKELECVQSACNSDETQFFIQWAGELCALVGGFNTDAASQGSSASAAASITPVGAASASSVANIQSASNPATLKTIVVTSGGGGVSPTQVQSGNAVSATAPAAPSTQQSTSSSSSVNPGVIAGPVVGGVAIIALVAVYFIRKRYSSHGHAGPTAAAAAGAPLSGAPMGKIMSESESEHGAPSTSPGGFEVGSGVYSAPISSANMSQDVHHHHHHHDVEGETEEEGPLSI